MKIYLSIKPKSIGGGSNTFSSLFKTWAGGNGHKIVKSIFRADLAIIIAHLADEKDLLKARNNGCRIVHRLDEYFEKHESEARREKHDKIIRLNKYADLTVFQSEFVFNNVYSYIKPNRYEIIYNGGNQRIFYPAEKPGNFIGHVTWGIDTKKRLDLLYEFIRTHSEDTFLLIGRHKDSEYNFSLPNVKVIGKVRQADLPKYYRMMRCLYFPSEKDPCPNTVIESILCGVPVCYNELGGTVELVRDCGLPLNEFQRLSDNHEEFRNRCALRNDLHFDEVASKYLIV